MLDHLDAQRRATVTEMVTICDRPCTKPNACAWLAAHPRWRFVFTSTHTSWLNPIELWFGILPRKVIRRGQFVSTDDLAAKLAAYIAADNDRAHPFRWTYTGKPPTA